MQTFAGKKILVTGADGFIASHLCEHLISKNDQNRLAHLIKFK